MLEEMLFDKTYADAKETLEDIRIMYWQRVNEYSALKKRVDEKHKKILSLEEDVERLIKEREILKQSVKVKPMTWYKVDVAEMKASDIVGKDVIVYGWGKYEIGKFGYTEHPTCECIMCKCGDKAISFYGIMSDKHIEKFAIIEEGCGISE